MARDIKSVPEQRNIDKCLRQITELGHTLEPFVAHLTPDQRRHTLKFRPGGEKIWALVTRLSEERRLELPNAPSAAVNRSFSMADYLRPVQSALDSITRAVADTILQAESQAWSGTTAYYTALQGQARGDAALRSELEPAVTFFSTGHHRKKVVTP